MNRKLLFKTFALATALSCTMGVHAHDFAEPGFYYNIIGTNTVEVTYNSSNSNYNSYTGSVSIPTTVTHDGVTYNVTKIGNYAFRNCDGLTAVKIPSTITSFGNFAFYNCPHLTSISIPYGVTSLGYDALGKTGLTYVTIPNSVTYMGSEMFYCCTSLQKVTLPESITNFDLMRSFQGCTSLTSIVIPYGVTTIKADAFNGCTSLKDVTIPRTVTAINQRAFAGCTALTTVSCFAITPPILPDNNVFPSEAYSNAKLQVPSAVQSAYQAADGWKLFNTINGVDYDFVLHNLKYAITSSTTVKCAGPTLNSPSGSWYIPETALGYDVTEIGQQAFLNCKDITSLEIGSKVKKIGLAAFYGCSGLTTMTIPDAVTYVEGIAFMYCTSLESVTIGKNCRFNDGAGWSLNIFQYCSNLRSITCLSKDAWEFHEPMFDASTYENAVLWVPAKSESNYWHTDFWNKFANIKGIYNSLDDVLNAEGGNLHFTTSSDYPWVMAMDDNGDVYAKSGNGGVASSTSKLETTVTVAEGTRLLVTFRACGEQSSSGTIYDECRCEVDGVEIYSLGVLFPTSWGVNCHILSAGTHTITWSYTKDSSVNPEGDYFGIMEVELEAPEFQRGDVNGNNQVDINDVTALINYVLSGDATNIIMEAANADQTGDVDINDITALINFVLTGTW